MLAAPLLALGACLAPELDVGSGALRSDWREEDARGRRLVRELGTLHSAGVGGTTTCGDLTWSLHFGQSSGRRHYDGVSTVGAPVVSSSRLRIDETRIEASAPWPGAWESGARVGRQTVRRDIASVGAVLGYPEKFAYWTAEVGVRRTFEADRWRLTLQGWLGGGPGGRLDLDLPGSDPAALKLGRVRSADASVELRYGDSTSGDARWGWRARLGWRVEDIAAGAAQALLRNGVVVGGAAQPRTRRSELGLGVALHARF